MAEALNEQVATAIVKADGGGNLALREFSAFTSVEDFAAAQRMGRMLSQSDLVPDTYRGETKIGNCVIAMEIANRIGANVVSVMQNLYIVHGRPAWSSQFLIACINACGKFTPLRYVKEGEGDNRSCYAWAQDKTGERLSGPVVSIAMAKAEGWYTKNGSKWKTMPELMLMYRAATLFARLYAPELTMGMRTDDEVIDITPVVTEPKQPDTATAERLAKAAVAAKPEPSPASALCGENGELLTLK